MKNKLPVLLFFIVLATVFYLQVDDVVRHFREKGAPPVPADAPAVALTTPAPALPAPPKTAGDQLIERAAAQLERRVSVAARLRHQSTLPGKSLIYGIGSYWQQGMGDELRVRLELQVAGQEASVLQVSDSRFLWVERRLPIGRSVTRVDLRQLRADTLLGSAQLADIQPDNANWLSSQSDLIAHSGGLPSLLHALGESFVFLPPQPMRIASDEEAGRPTTSIPFFAVVGHWRQDRLTKLLPAYAVPAPAEQGAPLPGSMPSNIDAVPARLPQEVLILFGQSDLFPYRIEYRKLETPIAANQAGAAIPYQLSARPMVVLEFTDVRFDIPTDTSQFIYTPGDAEWTDQTTALLERLRQQRNAQVATRASAPIK